MCVPQVSALMLDMKRNGSQEMSCPDTILRLISNSHPNLIVLMTTLLLGVSSSYPETFVDDRIGIPGFSLGKRYIFAISLRWTLS